MAEPTKRIGTLFGRPVPSDPLLRWKIDTTATMPATPGPGATVAPVYGSEPYPTPNEYKSF